MAPEKKTLAPGEVLYPKLTIAQRMVMPPTDAASYLSAQVTDPVVADEFIALIIKRYREGASARTIMRELSLGERIVYRWLRLAEEHHILHLRRTSDGPTEKMQLTKVLREEKILETKEASAEADAKLSAKLRAKAEMLLDKVTPEKAAVAKLKDLTGAIAQLLEKSRLLVDKSTQNTGAQSVVQFITQLGTMTLAERMALVEDRRSKQLPKLGEPTDVIDVTPVTPDELPDFLRDDDTAVDL